MVAVQTETLLRTESKPETEQVMQFLDEMTPAQQNEMLVFMQGMRFANNMQQGTKTASET